MAGTSRYQGLLRQQAVMAQFGELALRSEDLMEILTEACRLVGEALGTDLAKVMEIQPDETTMLVRAGVGWPAGIVGVASIPKAENSSEWYAIKTGEPMTSPNVAKERRFTYPAFLHAAGVKAVINVAIWGTRGRQPYGLLQVDSRRPRRFTDHDLGFLKGYANLLAAAVDRLRMLDASRAAMERQTLLTRELDHRAKNMLAVVQAALRLTKAKDIPSFQKAIEGRLLALARAQNALSFTNWTGAALPTLLAGELEAFLVMGAEGPRVTLDGPMMMLGANSTQPFSMAVHELATNAIKHGSLGVPLGKLLVQWYVEEDGPRTLHMRWTESGGPEIEGPPKRRGFGARVLDGTMNTQLRGTLAMEWHRAGLICNLTLPLADPAPV